MIKEVTKDTLGKEIENGIGIQILNFHATWCGPCKMMSPVLERIAKEKNIPVFKVDVEQDRNFAIEMQVSGTPTTFFYKNGVIVSRVVGFQAFEQFEEIINSL